MKVTVRAVLAVCAFTGAAVLHSGCDKLQPPLDLPVLGEVDAPLAFRDQDNQMVALQDLRGKVWVGALIFSRCAGQCPHMMRQYQQLQKRFPKDSRVKLLAVTVDPDYDTPEVLSHYAEKFAAETRQWRFLTGTMESIEALARDEFKLGASEPGSVEEAIFHSRRIVLVDASLQLRGYFDAFDENDMSRLPRAIEQLLKESQR